MRTLILVTFGLLLLPLNVMAQNQTVSVDWLEKAPAAPAGVSWGIPWPKGQVPKDTPFNLKTADGESLPLQAWPLAYWADGTLKWSGFATAVEPNVAGPFNLTRGAREPVDAGVKVVADATTINIDTGTLQCRIPKAGEYLFDSMAINDKVIATQARLECILQNGPTLDEAVPPERERFVSHIEKVTVEQSGPVRAVVKFEGKHKSVSGSREWLPFTVRLYFFLGQDQPVRMVHTVFYDGNEKQDFIRGLGVVVDVPFRDEWQNRHVRFGGEGAGIWAEPVQSVSAWGGIQPGGRGAYAEQLAGRRVQSRDEMSTREVTTLDTLAAWGEFRLIQPNAEGFTIEKATTSEASWIPAAAGKRSSGYAWVGDASGGLGVGLKDFWQAYPSALEIRGARTDSAELRVWMWSPQAPAMDVRHYDTVAHPLSSTYEDTEEDLSTSTPYGIARTHELTLFPSASAPDNQLASAQAASASHTPLLAATSQYLHDVGAFGIWPVEDRSTPLKSAVEDYLDSIIAFYQKQIDQSNWYGFWDYGDVMHSYDAMRHEWKYDFGGTAWDNSEQGTDMVLWYMFLHTGRADIFRMAEAMSRHTGEIDSYHFGPLAGLGSRHNVRHWGGGAKEARISMAAYRRYYYYLTTDERTGDVMHEMLQADESIVRVDPMRKADPITEADKAHPARVRAGPDWFALVGNWMTEWERTGDTKWRDKIYTGFDSIATFPHGIRTSRNLLWYLYPDTGKLLPRDTGPGGYNLVNQMGGPEIIFELNDMVDHDDWARLWRDYCSNQGGRYAAYMYRLTKDPQYAQKTIGTVTGVAGRTTYTDLRQIDGYAAVKPLVEGPNGLVTNGVNQSTLNLLEVLDMIGDQLPETAPPPAPRGPGRGWGRRNN